MKPAFARVRAELAQYLRALAELGVRELRTSPADQERRTSASVAPSSVPADSDASNPRNSPSRGGSDLEAAADRPFAPHAPRSGGLAERAAVSPVPSPAIEIVRAPLQEDLFGPKVEIRAGDDPAALLERLRRDEIGECTRCRLSGGRKTIVFGSGHPSAELMFIGEGPGADEDEQGLPFVGRAGQLLTKMIGSMVVRGRPLARDEVYIANIIKCRPPGNRDPEPDEIAACEGFLFQQIAIVRPRVIVTLGAFAARTLLRSKAPISALRGRFHEYRGTLLMPTFHPAYVLRNYTEETRRTVFEDLKKAAAMLERETLSP